MVNEMQDEFEDGCADMTLSDLRAALSAEQSASAATRDLLFADDKDVEDYLE